MRKLLLTAAVGVMLVPLAGCPFKFPHGQKLTFQPFTARDGRFTALMAGSPQRQTETAMGLNVVIYMVPLKDSAYCVGYADIPLGTPFDLHGSVQGVANYN